MSGINEETPGPGVSGSEASGSEGHGPGEPLVEDPGAHDAYDEPEEGPSGLGAGVGVEPTGYGPVDAGLRRLEDADHLAVPGHLEVYEDVHRGLRDTLAALDRPSPRS